jgi:hypothetical protein
VSKNAQFRAFKAVARVRTRWGDSIKAALTRSDARSCCQRCQVQHELRERAGSETAAAALQPRPSLSRVGSLVKRSPGSVQNPLAAAGQAYSTSIENVRLAAPPSAGVPEANSSAGTRLTSAPSSCSSTERSAHQLSLRGSTATPNRRTQLTNADCPQRDGSRL